MLSKEEVRAAMLRKLKASALGNGDIEKLGFQYFTAEEVSAKPKLAVSYPAAGFVLPYYNTDQVYTEFFRFRYLEQPKKNGFAGLTVSKELRYTQPPGLAPRVYFSPLWPWDEFFKGESATFFITEGELKANCACKKGFPTLALGGVWNFMSKTENIPLLEDLTALPLKDSNIYIVYDSDTNTNPEVLRAQATLCKQLLQQEAHPYIVRLPALEEGAKTGLDDYLVTKGDKAFSRLVTEAEEYEGSAALHAMNEEVIFLHKDNNILEPRSGSRWRPGDFSKGVYATRTYTVSEPTGKKGETKLKTLRTADEWVKWPGRAEVERVTYRPGAPLIIDAQYNMWKGWGLTDEYVKRGSTEYWDTLMDFVFKGEDAPHRKWFEQWCAYPLQHPGAKMVSAVILWGVEQGTGKTLIGHTLGRIYGTNFSEIDSTVLNSTHNEWAQYKQFVLGDEITGEEPGGKRKINIDTLKNLTTRQQIYLNPKYVSSYYLPDCINYLFTSNHPDAFRLEDQDRRFAIFELRGPKLDEEFFRKYDRWYKSNAVGALFYKLLHIDLSDFNPYGAAPVTKAKLEMINDARSDLGAWVAGLKSSPVQLIGEKRTLWTTAELFALYKPTGRADVTANGLARELKRQCFLKALNGHPVWTEAGPQKLWAINCPPTVKRPDEYAKLYNQERKGDILFQELKRKFEKEKKNEKV